MAGIRKAALKKSAHEAINPSSYCRTFCTLGTMQNRAEYRAELGAIADGLRREKGMQRPDLRAVAIAVRERRYSRGVNMSMLDALPDTALDGEIGRIRATGKYIKQGHTWSAEWAELHWVGHGVRALVLMAVTEAVRLDIGGLDAQNLLSALTSGSKKHISGYLADTIIAWQRGELDGSAGYERCSGGEKYTWFRNHPETWDLLLSHAPQGQHTETAIQCYPHERAKSKACHDAGLFETFRVSDSIYSGTREQVARVLQQIAA